MVNIPIPISLEARAATRKIADISGENLHKCMQCGTCSATCPMVDSMRFTTRQAMHLLHFGRVHEVVQAAISEFCASCHTCKARCPRGIDVPRVFEAVRQLTLRGNVDLINVNEIDEEVLAEAPQIAFVSSFRKLTA